MKLYLTERKIETPDVESFFFKFEKPLRWKAGQFFHYILHHEPTDDRGSDRWFTIASAPSEDIIQLTTRFSEEKSSSFKKTLHELLVDDSIEISDLDGDFIVENVDATYIFIAGGIGITPFRAILKDLQHHNQQPTITLLYANKDEHIAFKEEIDTYTTHNPHFTVHYITSPEKIDIEKIVTLTGDLHKPLFYISGPESMVESIGIQLKEHGVPESHLKQDWFPGYHQ